MDLITGQSPGYNGLLCVDVVKVKNLAVVPAVLKLGIHLLFSSPEVRYNSSQLNSILYLLRCVDIDGIVRESELPTHHHLHLKQKLCLEVKQCFLILSRNS